MRRNFLAVMIGAVASLFDRRVQATTSQTESVSSNGAPDAPMIAALPYKRVTVDGANALQEWQRLRETEEGWPVVIGDDEALGRIAEQYSIEDPAIFPQPPGQPATTPPTPEQIIAAADTVTIPEALEQFWRQEYGSDPEDDAMPEEGEWPSSTKYLETGFTIASDILTGKPYGRVHILILPTTKSYEVPAYLRWGNWNACPRPEVHVAVLRYWHERYGAELVGINGDTINMRVSARPKTREEAMSLAQTQFYYCSDIVYQGTETLRPLAAGLMASNWWFFWWD